MSTIERSEIPGDARLERLVRFRIAGLSLAIRMRSIVGLIAPFRLRELAGAPPGVIGLSEWRGRLLTILDLATLLGVPGGPDDGEACLVRLAEPHGSTALRVPAPIALVRHRGRVGPPRSGSDLGPAVVGVALIDGVPHDVLDPGALLTRHPAGERDASGGG